MEFKIGDKIESLYEVKFPTGERVFGVIVAKRVLEYNTGRGDNFLIQRLDGGGNTYHAYEHFKPKLRNTTTKKYWSVFSNEITLCSKYPAIKTKFLEGFQL